MGRDAELNSVYVGRRFEIYWVWDELVAEAKYPEALALIERALAETEWLDGVVQSDATHAYFYKLMGDSYAYLQNNRRAAKWYIKSLRLESGYYEAAYTRWRPLAKILRQAGKPQWAANCFEKVQNPRHRIYWRWDEAEETEDWQKALAVIEEALSEDYDSDDPSEAYHRVALQGKKGIAYDSLGQPRLAVIAGVAAIREMPDYSPSWVTLGYRLQEMGKLHWANGCFKKVGYEIMEEDPPE